MPDDKKYEVGYMKPPKATQFKKGESGNPKGRPKGCVNVATLAQQVLSERVTVTEKGRERTMPMAEVLVRQAVTKAAKGDLKAIPLVLNLADYGAPEPEEEENSKEQHQLHLHNALLKLRRGLQVDPNKKENAWIRMK